MTKYTANYKYTNPKFINQNLITNQTNTDLLPILCYEKRNLNTYKVTELLISEFTLILKFHYKN